MLKAKLKEFFRKHAQESGSRETNRVRKSLANRLAALETIANTALDGQGQCFASICRKNNRTGPSDMPILPIIRYAFGDASMVVKDRAIKGDTIIAVKSRTPVPEDLILPYAYSPHVALNGPLSIVGDMPKSGHHPFPLNQKEFTVIVDQQDLPRIMAGFAMLQRQPQADVPQGSSRVSEDQIESESDFVLIAEPDRLPEPAPMT